MSYFLRSLVRSTGKSCEGKISYLREDSAVRNAEAMIKKKGNGEIFEHYKCAYCEGWHIGHRTNFDWIPSSHLAHRLMLNMYHCYKATPHPCNFEWFTTTVLSTRILTHFPGIQTEVEKCVRCPKCKADSDLFWCGRKWIDLELISPESILTVEQLWEQGTETFSIVDNNKTTC